MTSDVVKEIGAVAREVRAVEREGRPARVVVASRRYDTTIEDVWDAITNAERIPRWFLPVSGDLRVGGRYELKGNASGTIARCDAPRHLAVTWEFGGEVSWLDVRLHADPAGGTTLELEHVAHVSDERWAQFGPGAVGVGWDLTLRGLDRHLETRADSDPAAWMAWAGSPEGKDFMRRSSETWGRASIEAGTDAATANAAAARTTAFYTGEEAPGGEKAG